MIQNYSSVTLFIICVNISVNLTDGHNLLILNSYNVQKPSCGSLTPYIKTCIRQVTKSLKICVHVLNKNTHSEF